MRWQQDHHHVNTEIAQVNLRGARSQFEARQDGSAPTRQEREQLRRLSLPPPLRRLPFRPAARRFRRPMPDTDHARTVSRFRRTEELARLTRPQLQHQFVRSRPSLCRTPPPTSSAARQPRLGRVGSLEVSTLAAPASRAVGAKSGVEAGEQRDDAGHDVVGHAAGAAHAALRALDEDGVAVGEGARRRVRRVQPQASGRRARGTQAARRAASGCARATWA